MTAERFAASFRAAVNRLRDPANLSVNLTRLLQAARALGKKLEINLA